MIYLQKYCNVKKIYLFQTLSVFLSSTAPQPCPHPQKNPNWFDRGGISNKKLSILRKLFKERDFEKAKNEYPSEGKINLP